MIFGIRRWPIVPTLVVLVAAAIMVKLGFWQLGRMHEEQGKLARFEQAAELDAPIAFPASDAPDREQAAYRRSTVECAGAGEWRTTAGRNSQDRAGYVQIVECLRSGGEAVEVQAGWSGDLAAPDWNGGTVQGIIAPNRDGSMVLVADPPLAGLEANALPTPSDDQPAKNLSYAVQWFAFALTALVIYVLALRRRQRDRTGA
ncbi:SURF1 family protein [Aurantiacibacter xanthus]|uniref:SURF1 family protein n=1 Tax=Aurantiacibacter xanthus TaxID=1784712 RepID=UPI001FE7978D|nr:SURF1 family protein [Aurantiacibacter xanthus]